MIRLSDDPHVVRDVAEKVQPWVPKTKRSYVTFAAIHGLQPHVDRLIAEAVAKAEDAATIACLRAEVERKDKALRSLYRAYVNTLEIGRDRIVMLGGDCDPVSVMENGDPALVAARAALSDGAAP